MMEDMPSSLLDKWYDFHRLEPFGQQWQNWLMAVPLSNFVKVHSKKGTVVKASDYFYEDEQSKKDREQATFIKFLDTFEPK